MTTLLQELLERPMRITSDAELAAWQKHLVGAEKSAVTYRRILAVSPNRTMADRENATLDLSLKRIRDAIADYQASRTN